MLIFNNILTTGVYPEMWKHANATVIHKKGSKQLTKKYHYCQYVEKYLEKLSSKPLHLFCMKQSKYK